MPTVRGLVDAASLGLVLPSEQLCFDSRDRHRFDTGTHTLRDAPITLDRLAELRAAPLASLTNLTHPGEAALSHELGRLTRSAGSATVVDLTPAAAHSGRDPLALRRLSEKAGVHVIMSTGCSMHQVAVALATTSAETVEAAEAEVVEQLASALVEDLLNGVPAGDTSVRAGALCLETLPSSSSSTEAVLLRVMANAQQRTGAPLFCALLPPAAADADAAERLERAAAALQSLVSGGASPGHLVVTQAQHGLAHPAALRAWLQLGVHLCFDGIGMSWAVAGFGTPDSDPWALPPSDDELSRAIVALVVEGFGSQVVLSHGIASRLQLACGGGGGLTYLSHAFLPRARRWGLTPEVTPDSHSGARTRTHARHHLAG